MVNARVVSSQKSNVEFKDNEVSVWTANVPYKLTHMVADGKPVERVEAQNVLLELAIKAPGYYRQDEFTFPTNHNYVKTQGDVFAICDRF